MFVMLLFSSFQLHNRNAFKNSKKYYQKNKSLYIINENTLFFDSDNDF